MDLAKRRAEITAILTDIETAKDRLMHMPETDAAEAIEIIERIERKLFPAGMPR